MRGMPVFPRRVRSCLMHVHDRSVHIGISLYNYRVVRQFTLMTVVWGIIGMGLGVFIAAQLVWPVLNFDLP